MGDTLSVTTLETYYASICCDRKSAEIAKRAQRKKRRKKRRKKQQQQKLSGTAKDGIDCSKSVAGCKLTMRVIACLRYCKTLNNANSDKLIKYCHKRSTLLNDIIHVITTHNNELEEINNLIVSKCDLSNCALLRRHFRDRNNDIHQQQNIADIDKEFLFWRELIDSVHCYIFHLYDAGLRIKIGNDELDENAESEMQHFDEEFSKIWQQINKQKHVIKQPENSKFSINANEDSEKGMTFLDGLCRHLIEECIFMRDLNALKRVLYAEEFDSDAVKQDFIDNADGNQSNIIQWISNETYSESCKDYIKNTLLSAWSFNIGYIFYYWSYYKKQRKRKHDIEFFTNKNDHSGFQLFELYVERKYKSLKDEVLNNTICTLELHQFQSSLHKAKKCSETDAAKKLSAGIAGLEDPLHYEIATGTKIAVDNLLCVIMYCDWSGLCTQFCKTFRKIKAWETITSVKRRNSEYANWSKILRETVQYFGCMGWDYTESEKWNKDRNTERGPFYCGMSVVLVIPEFNIRLCSPTSTSKQIAVATKFGGDKGIIIQLNNNGGVGSHMLRCFDCSWLSNYKGEDERLFIGGDWSIKIETIRNIETRQNYIKFFKPLFYFDCMLSGTQIDDEVVSESEIQSTEYFVLQQLIKHKLAIDAFKNDFPHYINQTFEAFTKHKKQIVINPYLIQHGLAVLQDLMMHSLTPIFVNHEIKGNNTGNRLGLNGFKKKYGKSINKTLCQVGTYTEYTAKAIADPFLLASTGINTLKEVQNHMNATDGKNEEIETENAPQIAANQFNMRSYVGRIRHNLLASEFAEETNSNIKEWNIVDVEDTQHSAVKKPEEQSYNSDTLQLLTDAHQIAVNPFLIGTYVGKVKDLMLANKNNGNVDDIELNIPMGMDNLFKPILFETFSNIKHIVIFSTGFDGDPQYLMNVYSLLSLLTGSRQYISKGFTLTIKASHQYIVNGEEWAKYEFEHVDTSWISKLWNKSCKTIKAKYRAKGYDISLVIATQILLGVYRLREDRLLIQRL